MPLSHDTIPVPSTSLPSSTISTIVASADPQLSMKSLANVEISTDEQSYPGIINQPTDFYTKGDITWVLGT